MLRLNLTKNLEESIIQEIFLPLSLGSDFAQELNDDVAFIKQNKKVLIKTDSLTEGVHCKVGTSGYKMGYKLLARCISDIASKGGYPIGFTVAIFKPSSFAKKDLKDFSNGLKHFKIPLIGGDISNTNSKYFSANITIFASFKGRKIPERKNAKVGENIYITGKIGRAFLGFIGKKEFLPNYETPTPNLALMQKIHEEYKVSSAIDVSDGFIKDITSLLNASRVGAEVDASLIIDAKFRRHAKEMLTFGDDYQTIFTSKEDIVESEVIKIGTITKGNQLIIRGVDFDLKSNDQTGYTFAK